MEDQNLRDTHFLKPGTILENRYCIRRVIGEGGFGITYEAVNQKIDMTVAIKEFFCREYVHRDVEQSDQIQITYTAARESFEKAKKRFLQEAKILSGFSDEDAVVKIIDCFEENGTAYIVMNYLRGIPLNQYIQEQGPMKWETMIEKMNPLMRVLERMNNRGVVHRDISANNIMVLENGSLCLLDFGTAKDLMQKENTTTTAAFTKQGYTPIEQYANHGNVGPWSDVYALAAVCYECLTGECPPDSLQRSVFDEYKTLREQGVDAPKELESILKKALAVKTEKRYANMGELMEALGSISLGRRKKKRKRITALLAFSFLLAAVGACLGMNYREELLFRFEATETFFVVREEGASVEDLETAYEKIEKRIEKLAGENPYIWEEEKNGFRGVVPLKCFGDENPRTVIQDLFLNDSAQDELQVDFSVYTQIQSDWLTRQDDSEFGKKQCEADELGENRITIEYGPRYSEGLLKGDTENFIYMLKKRLDLLNIPYALGRGYNEKDHITLCVNQKDYNKDLFFLLLKEDVDIDLTDVRGKTIANIGWLGEIKEKDGTASVAVNPDYYDAAEARRSIKKASQDMADKNSGKYYLAVQNIRLLEGKLKKQKNRFIPIKDGVFEFSSIKMDTGKIDSENKDILKLLNEIISAEFIGNRYAELCTQITNGDTLVADEPAESRTAMRFNTSEEDKTVQKIKDLSESYEAESRIDYETGRERLSVMLLDQIYAETVTDCKSMADQVSRIIAACGLSDESPWTAITIGIKSRYVKDSYAGKIALYRYNRKKYKYPYTISVIGYEEKEAAWLKKVSATMRSDKRFEGYKIEFIDYSDM